MHLDGVKILGFEYTQSFLKNHQNVTKIFGLKMKKRFFFLTSGIPTILVGVWVAVMTCVTENGFHGRFEIQTFPIWIILGPMYLVLMVA